MPKHPPKDSNNLIYPQSIVPVHGKFYAGLQKMLFPGDTGEIVVVLPGEDLLGFEPVM